MNLLAMIGLIILTYWAIIYAFDVIIIKYNELSRWLKITNYFRIILLQTDRPTRFHAP